MNKKQIFIVEGDRMLAERIKQNLEAEQYRVDVFYQGNNAILALKAKWVDLIITSITLQGSMNGIQFLQEIKKHGDFQKIPVIVQTSKINMKKMVDHFKVDFFITKPYQMFDLIEQVNNILHSKTK